VEGGEVVVVGVVVVVAGVVEVVVVEVVEVVEPDEEPPPLFGAEGFVVLVVGDVDFTGK
jgi:hypothetical protein